MIFFFQAKNMADRATVSIGSAPFTEADECNGAFLEINSATYKEKVWVYPN